MLRNALHCTVKIPNNKASSVLVLKLRNTERKTSGCCDVGFKVQASEGSVFSRETCRDSLWLKTSRGN